MQLKIDTLGQRCQWLGLAIGGVWLLTVPPARYFFGIAGIEASAVSAACCLLAGWLTFLFVARARQPRLQAFAVLLGTLFRGVFALLGALVMQYLLGLTFDNYLIWLSVFYLVALALETFFLLRSPARANAS
jgi:hypothetical protein